MSVPSCAIRLATVCALLPWWTIALAETSTESPAVATVPVAASPADEIDPGVRLDPIVVTADKREQTLGTVATGVSVLRGDTLDDVGARGAEDFARLVPGLSLNKEASDRSDYPIRGVATDTRFTITQRATGIYVDEIPLSDPFIPISQPDLNPFDLDRVEVLKGPQATLHGSTGLAGVIRYVTRKPEPGEFRGVMQGSLLETEGGRDRQPHAGAMLNVPLGESAALRGAVVRRRDPGYIDDTFSGTEDVGAVEQEQSRVRGVWVTPWDFDLDVMYLSQDTQQDDLPYADQPERLEHGNALAPSPSSSIFDVGNLVATWRLPIVTLTSSTGVITKEAHLRFESARTLGTDSTEAPIFNTADTIGEGVTQEIRLTSHDDDSPWSWLVGLWYSRYESTYDQHLPAPGTALPLDPLGEEDELAYGHFRSRGTEQAVFADVGRQLWETWTVSLGGRYYQTDLRSHNVTGGLLITAAAGGRQTNQDQLQEEGVNPRVSLRWNPTPDAMAYALVSRGFRFGGIQLTPPTELSTAGTNIEDSFKSDTLWNHEVGARTAWLDNRLTVDLSLFYGKWKDLQITRTDNTGLFNFVQNIASANTRGAELGINLVALAGLQASIAATYVDAHTDELFVTSAGEVPAGTRLPGAPRHQATGLLGYELPLRLATPGLEVICSWIGPYPNNLFATQTLGDYTTLDVRAHVTLGTLPLHPRVALGMSNVTDERGLAGAFAEPGSGARDYYFITPRTVALSTTLSF
ncbi:MAG TPA: TonB-dependent receptor [Verrucomicrobiae bacterium]|nr:TonB-dependent receptor [Verrucomicrobiae bacterium]